jgi:hypothetical protein
MLARTFRNDLTGAGKARLRRCVARASGRIKIMENGQNFAANHAVRPLVSPLTAQLAFAGGDFPVAAENMRRLAGEIAGMSAVSLEQTRGLIEDVRAARQMDDLVAIQAKYVASMFQSFAEGSRRMGLLLADWPRDVTQASRDMFEASMQAAHNVADVTATALAAANVNEFTPMDRLQR